MDFITSNFIFFVTNRSNYKKTITLFSIVLISFCTLILPFYFYDPLHFSPLHVSDFLTIKDKFPRADIIIVLGGLCLSTFLGIRFKNKSLETLIKSCFYVQAYLIMTGFILASFAEGKVNLYYLHFGMFLLPFGVLSSAPQLLSDALNRGFPKL